MCGIMGYIGNRPCVSLIFEGLEKLEYRGYDSAGIAVFDHRKGRDSVQGPQAIKLIKAEGKLAKLKPLLTGLPEGATCGVGHTRWATHGKPSVENAHPHGDEEIVVIHNGIIENYRELKSELAKKGYSFRSETDTEVVVYLLREALKSGMGTKDAVFSLISKLEGAYAFGIMMAKEPSSIFVVKQGSPLVIGLGEGENFFASDALALISHTKKVIFLDDGEIARISADGVTCWNFAGEEKPPISTHLDLVMGSMEKQGYRHFMLKEIHEQPSVIANTVRRLVDLKKETFCFDTLGLEEMARKVDLTRIESIQIVACGTAYHAGFMAKYCLEPLCGIPVNVELASEFRYRAPHLTPSSLVIAFSQSGETADTLASVKHSAALGANILSICNVRHSAIPRSSHATLYMDAGPEIGVASTKAFTSMLLCLYVFSLGLAAKRGRLDESTMKDRLEELRVLPFRMEKAAMLGPRLREIAEGYYEMANCLYIGRGTSFPIALEGALKLKEISYIHAEGYAGGELKHGPIALVDRHMPVIAVVPKDQYFEKMLSNVEEVRARGGRVIMITDEKTLHGGGHYGVAELVSIPHTDEPILQAILSTIPLQLLAYYVAVRRGTDVDQPRNLAKSVTVE